MSKLYHGTSITRARQIIEDARIDGPSYWGDNQNALKFANDQAAEDDSEPVVFAVEVSRFDPDRLAPDDNSIDANADANPDLYESFVNSGAEWRASLDHFGCARYDGSVPVSDRDIDPDLNDGLEMCDIFPDQMALKSE